MYTVHGPPYRYVVLNSTYAQAHPRQPRASGVAFKDILSFTESMTRDLPIDERVCELRRFDLGMSLARVFVLVSSVLFRSVSESRCVGFYWFDASISQSTDLFLLYSIPR